VHLKLGTRASALALAQSGWVASKLQAAHPDLSIELVHITTTGDRSQAANTPLSSSSEKGVFAKEIEQALLDRSIDLAVHSMKDLASTLPDGLIIAAVPAREDPRDALIGAQLDKLPTGARVGTGSVRRRALLCERRPDLTLLEIRGNVDTRLRKLADGEYDAIVLACAGLKRLGRADAITERLDPFWFTPDPGQGALAIETREDDTDLRHVVSALNNRTTAICVAAERAYLQALGGGCSTPVGAWANFPDRQFTLHAMMADEVGIVRRINLVGDRRRPEDLGRRVADAIRLTPAAGV
jgi:hydroxymethylbilane synthase